MRLFILPFFCFLILMAGCAVDRSQEIDKLQEEIADLKTMIGPPPGSLDNLYPPKAEAPILLLRMFDLANSLAGISVNFFENDLENAHAHYEKFKTQYSEIAKLVPEWERAYPMEPVEELGTAISSGDQEQVMAAFGKIDRVCYECHIANTSKVQQKYHWDDYHGLSMMDPVTKKEINFKQFKQQLWSSFGGIGVDLEEGQPENALKHFEDFKKRFQVLEETCEVCHETTREYYVDENAKLLIERLGAVLKSSSPELRVVGELSQEIGTESCLKCHRVHSPVAFAKARWEN